MQRVAIAHYFLHVMEAPPEREDSATASWILKHLEIPPGSRATVKTVIKEARECAKNGWQYTGDKATSSRVMLAAIPLNSPAARIIADTMEGGGTIKRAHANCMAYLWARHEAGKPDVPFWGLSATYSCYLRMNPTVTVVEK